MKLIAHRGWSAGRDENTLAAFARAAADSRIAGVEFDVCRAADAPTLLASHDPPLHVGDTPTFDAALSFLAQTQLELFVEIKQAGLAPAVIERLLAAGAAERAVVFGFADVARSFPWRQARPLRLGVIVMGPWNIDRVLRAHAPDVLMLGWDARAWTRIAFRSWWSCFSLDRCARRHRLPIVAGIVQHAKDLDWLARQGVHGAVADIDRVFAAADARRAG